MMKYRFEFYKEEYYDEILELILNSYQWDKPAFGLSRMEFGHGLHPYFCGFFDAWQRTVGVYLLDNVVVASVINEGSDEAQAFFLFREECYTQDRELLADMIQFAKTTMSGVKEDRITRFISVAAPKWNITLMEMLEQAGFVKTEQKERILIRPFIEKRAPVVLPPGYRFADANSVPSFFAANVHMAAFNYSMNSVPNATKAFQNLQKEKHYDPSLHLFVLDAQNRPVGMANVWYDERMPYCELEPLGVVFWERRKGLASALLDECENRIMEKYPKCGGMSGGDQPFYTSIGYEVANEILMYQTEFTVYPSWDNRSDSKEIN